MPYEQQGNSCGAWCAAHRTSIGNHARLGMDSFVRIAKQVYGQVMFRAQDGDTGWAPRIRGMFGIWCANRYCDPWRIATYLQRSGIAPAVSIEAGAMGALGQLADMRFILQNLGSRNGRVLHRGALTGLPSKAYAIAVFRDVTGGLHYLLLRSARMGFQAYDPRSHQLNWCNVPRAPAFGGPFRTTIVAPAGRKQDYTYLGVFIRC